MTLAVAASLCALPDVVSRDPLWVALAVWGLAFLVVLMCVLVGMALVEMALGLALQ